MLNDPKTLGLALLVGIIPSLVWLWFWLKEDQKKAEPKGLLTVCFIAGMLAVILVLPIQKLIKNTVSAEYLRVIGWATIEEIMKYVVVVLVLWKTTKIKAPVEWPIYLITAALGFAALENTLFLIEPISTFWSDSLPALLTGQLRFLGSTLLHSITSAIIGIALGLSLHMDGWKRKRYLIIGILLSITLHSVFNFFIIQNNGSNFLKVFGFLWVVTIIIMLLFEKLRRMPTILEESR